MRLADYPFVLVRFGCQRCRRKGQYRLARLAATYGPETHIEAVLDMLTLDCAFRTGGDRLSFKEGMGTCWATMVDLNNATRPPDLPPDMLPFTVIQGGKKRRDPD